MLAPPCLFCHCWWLLCHCMFFQLCPTLCNPMTAAHQAPLLMEFSRQEYWSGLSLSSPGDPPNPGIKLRSPALQTDSLPAEPPGKRYTTCQPNYTQNPSSQASAVCELRASRCKSRVLEKVEEPEFKLPTFVGSQNKQENSRKMSTSASLTMLKPLTVWITTNYGNFLEMGVTHHPTCILNFFCHSIYHKSLFKL